MYIYDSMYVYVYKYIDIYIYICIFIYMCIYACIHIYIYREREGEIYTYHIISYDFCLDMLLFQDVFM